MPQVFTDANFNTAVLRNKLPVLVDFWAPWCAPCKMLAPVLAALEPAYANRLIIGKLDTDANPKTANTYHVASIPYLVIFIGGKPVAAVEGAVPRKVLVEMIDQALAAKPLVGASAGARTKKPTSKRPTPTKKPTAPIRKKSK